MWIEINLSTQNHKEFLSASEKWGAVSQTHKTSALAH